MDENTQLMENGAVPTQPTGETRHRGMPAPESFDVIVIGGGQAGLSVGYHLARAGARFVILDANTRIGDSWRKRWDSLRLFSPAKLDGLDGMRFPSPRNHFPSKDEMATYLEEYARRFSLPVRNGVRVQRLFKRCGRYRVAAGTMELEASSVVVAMGKYQRPKLPAFAAELSADIVQLHSGDYRNPDQLQPGGVLLVGAGNSGADIALEAARGGHKTWLAGRDTGEIPFRPERLLGRTLFVPLLLRFVFHHVMTVRTPLGRRARPGVLAKGGPLIRVKRKDLAAAGVSRAPRVIGARNGSPLLEGGNTLAVANIIWCGEFELDFEWIDIPIFDQGGQPNHQSGVIECEPGLYFIGLPFLHAMSSSMIHGVGRDAARIVSIIRSRLHAAALPA